MEGRTILVTGGAGFIGRGIIKACEEKGWKTISLDPRESKLADVSIKGSINDLELLRECTRNVDFVFHEAAVTSPPQFEEEPVSSFNLNTSGTLNVLKAASENGVQKIVMASSSAVYGDLKIPGVEDQPKPVYQNLYPLSKSVNEQTAAYFSSRGDIETVCLRYFNTYGIGENSKGAYSSVISKFVNDFSRGNAPVIFGDGSQRRDFVYIDDVAEANMKALENGKSGSVYNVGTGTSTTFNDIYSIVREETGSDFEPEYKPIPYKSYQMFTQADIAKSERELGFKAKYSIRDGVRKMLSESIEV